MGNLGVLKGPMPSNGSFLSVLASIAALGQSIAAKRALPCIALSITFSRGQSAKDAKVYTNSTWQAGSSMMPREMMSSCTGDGSTAKALKREVAELAIKSRHLPLSEGVLATPSLAHSMLTRCRRRCILAFSSRSRFLLSTEEVRPPNRRPRGDQQPVAKHWTEVAGMSKEAHP